MKAARLHHLLARYVRGRKRRETFLEGFAHRVVAEAHLKQSGFVLQEDEFVASQFGCAREVQQVELMTDFEVG